MARRYEHAHEESRQGRTTRGAAVLAGGALVFASLVAATSPAAAGDATPVPALTAPASDEATVSGLVVEHSSPAGASAATRVAAGARITASEAGTSTITFATPTSAEEAERLAHQIEQLPGVTEVSLNAVLHPAAAPPGGAPGDPYFSELTGIWDSRSSVSFAMGGKARSVSLPAGGYSTKAPSLWRLTKGSSNVTVAVLDTGQTPHPDLDANTVKGYDFVSSTSRSADGDGRDADPSDPGDYFGAKPSSWHGTHVAGTIAAAENGVGVIGNAPGVRIQHVRVLGRGGGDMKDIADGIAWAAGAKVSGAPKNTTPAKVLNLSLAGPGKCQPYLQKAINKARKRGAVLIVAAGNEGENAKNFMPGNCKNVITVAATDTAGGRTSYTNYGKNIDLAAPGGADTSWSTDSRDFILSTWNLGTMGQGKAGYNYMAGTSMAAPGVSGVAALAASLRPGISGKQLERVVRNAITKFPNRTTHGARNCAKKKVCGKGMTDASRVPTTFLAKPKVKNALVGRKAKANPQVVAPNATFKYQWLRNGKKIKGATKKTYKIAKKDLGKKLSVRITAKLKGFPKSKIKSSTVKVKKNTPKVKAALKKKTVKRSQRARVTVTVNAGVTKKPTGKIKVTYGKKSKTYTLKKSHKGKLTVKLPKLSKGKHTVRAKYTPAKSLKKYVSSKSSKKVTLRVK